MQERMQRIAVLLVSVVLALLPMAAMAATYHVGEGQTYATMHDLLAAATPGEGDTILLHAGVYPPFRVEKGGGESPETAPVIRAYDMSNRPIIDAAGKDNAVVFEHPTGKWWAIDGLEIRNASFRGVFNVECGLVMRHCYVHDCHDGFMGGMHNTRESSPGYLIAEHNEFARNGSGIYAHQLYVQEYWAVFRYNYIHDNTGGSCYKDRSRQSLVAYNLIEQGPGATYAVEFCGCGGDIPEHAQSALMIGNIVTKKKGGNSWLFIANIRSEGGAEGALNTGHLTLINNTFYTEDHSGPMLGTDEGSIITAHNNIFHSTTCVTLVAQVMDATGPGKLDPSRNNWVNLRIVLPNEFADTVTGDDPGFVRAAWEGGDFRLLPSSPCIDVGLDLASPRPALEYLHPHAFTFRPQRGRVDIGAFEAR